MKRSILFSTVAAVAFATGFVGMSAVQQSGTSVTRVSHYEGEPCDFNGFAGGYMVSGGIDGGWMCISQS